VGYRSCSFSTDKLRTYKFILDAATAEDKMELATYSLQQLALTIFEVMREFGSFLLPM
jgi:hypothetical protein